MIKVGDRVALFENMARVGTVVGLRPQKSNQWIAGGVMEHIFLVQIQLDENGIVEEYRADRVMRIE